MRKLLSTGVAFVFIAMAAPGVSGADPSYGDQTITPEILKLKDKDPKPTTECITQGGTSNVKLDCDNEYPNYEPSLQVDPADPLHVVAASMDFGRDEIQYYTTFDGGNTWDTGNLQRRSHLRSSSRQRFGADPIVSFDRKHNIVLVAALDFTVAKGNLCDSDVVVSPSRDGGLHWDRPQRVGDGTGCFGDKTDNFSDKPWMVTDNDPTSPYYGRTYVTWTGFIRAYGSQVSNAIYESHSDNGGYAWSPAQIVSGSNPALCTVQTTGPAGECDENQFSVPTVRPDGTVFVAFVNRQNVALWENPDLNASPREYDRQYLVVSSSDGGATWTPPRFVVGLENGADDYPNNAFGRQTLSGYQVRVHSAGNITADPHSGMLYLVFSDNRNGTQAQTNADVFIVSSSDGTTWSSPSIVDPSPSDQWFPWVDVNPVTGTVGVFYHDRSEATPALYNSSLSEGTPGSFVKRVISTAGSDATDAALFVVGSAFPSCPKCAYFHGDYIELDYGSDGRANMVWTDMREFLPDPLNR